MVALDPLGHGGSDLPRDRAAYHEARLPDDVVAVMDAEGLWGYSRGARIAYLTALARPDRVAAVVAGGAAAWTAAESRPRYAIWPRFAARPSSTTARSSPGPSEPAPTPNGWAQLHVVAGAHHGAAFLAGPEIIPLVEAFLENAVG